VELLKNIGSTSFLCLDFLGKVFNLIFFSLVLDLWVQGGFRFVLAGYLENISDMKYFVKVKDLIGQCLVGYKYYLENLGNSI